MNEKRELASWEELHFDPEKAFKNDQYKIKLNQRPPNKWLKPHPMAKVKNENGESVPARYLPIDKVEFMLDMIFQDWKVEILREGVMFNSVYVTIRLHYLHPVKNEWLFHDGAGAQVLQTDAGHTGDMAFIKSSAVQMALPSAISYAIKDATEHLGKLFGRDVNRLANMEFTGAYSGNGKTERPPDKSESRMIDMIKNSKNRDHLSKLLKDLTTQEHRDLYEEYWGKLS